MTERWLPVRISAQVLLRVVAGKFCGSEMPAGLSPLAWITAELASDGAKRSPLPGKALLLAVVRQGGNPAVSQPRLPVALLRFAPRPAPLPHPDRRARYLPGLRHSSNSPRRRHPLHHRRPPRRCRLRLLMGLSILGEWRSVETTGATLGLLALGPAPPRPREMRRGNVKVVFEVVVEG